MRETSMFLLTSSERFVNETGRRLDRISPWTKNGTVQAKQSRRLWLYLVLQCMASSRRKFGISSQWQWRDYFARRYVGKRTGQGGHFCRCSFRSEGKTQTLTKPWATPGDRLHLGISGQPEEPKTPNEKAIKSLSHFQLDEASLEVSKHIDNGSRLDQDLFAEKSEQVDYYLVSHRDVEIHAAQIGNLEWHEVSKIEDRVQCHICFQYRRPGQTFFHVVACCNASPRRWRSRQSDKSRVDSSRTFQAVSRFTTEALTSKGSTFWTHCRVAKTQESERLLGFRARSTIAERSWSATSRTRSIKGAWTKNDTGNPTWKNLTEQQMQLENTSIFLQNGLTAEADARWYNPAKEEATKGPRKDRSTILNTNNFSTVARQCPVPDAEQWSSLVSWTWSPSTQSSWWDSSSSQTWRQSPKPTSPDVPALVLNTRKESSSARLVVATQLRRIFFIFELIEEWQPERGVYANTQSRALSQRCCSSQTHIWRTAHTSALLRFRVGLKSHSIKSSNADLRCPGATVTTSTSTTWHSCALSLLLSLLRDDSRNVWQFNGTPFKHRLWAQLYQHYEQ